MSLTRLKPAVPKHWLIAIAGLVWSGAGGMLCRMAWGWLRPLPPLRITGLVAAGIVLALILQRIMLARDRPPQHGPHLHLRRTRLRVRFPGLAQLS